MSLSVEAEQIGQTGLDGLAHEASQFVCLLQILPYFQQIKVVPKERLVIVHSEQLPAGRRLLLGPTRAGELVSEQELGVDQLVEAGLHQLDQLVQIATRHETHSRQPRAAPKLTLSRRRAAGAFGGQLVAVGPTIQPPVELELAPELFRQSAGEPVELVVAN